MLEQFNFVGMELSEEYVKIAEARIEHARQQRGLFNA
jgi:DNA modification methylase